MYSPRELIGSVHLHLSFTTSLICVCHNKQWVVRRALEQYLRALPAPAAVVRVEYAVDLVEGIAARAIHVQWLLKAVIVLLGNIFFRYRRTAQGNCGQQ